MLKKSEMEYEDAPSGYVTLYSYKEPLMKYAQGFGFRGVLLFDGVSEKIQCHLCGEWFGSLPHHLSREHGMFARDYKQLVGLRQTTALLSESARSKLVASGLDKRMQNLRNIGRKGKFIMTDEVKEKIRNTLKKNRFVTENQNERGTCPEQIIERLVKMYKENGNKTPSSRMLPFYEAMLMTYGSYKKACEVANIPYNDPLEALARGRETRSISDEDIIEFIFSFYNKENRLPVFSDYVKEDKNNLHDKLLKSDRDSLEKKAIMQSGRYTASLSGTSFTPTELLDFLRMFEKMHGRRPSYSDAKRGLIPGLSRYSYHFGSWKEALIRAFN